MRTIALSLMLASCALLAQAPPTAAPAPAAPRLPASPRGLAATQVSGKWALRPDAKPGDEPRYTEGKWISVDYGRPILRGRADIFGKGADYGKKISGGPVWRAGANQTTKFKTEVPLLLGGKALAAGEYDLFVDLKSPKVWTLVLSTQPTQTKYDPTDKTAIWGSDGYDPKFDVLRVPLKLAKSAQSLDMFTIQFVNMTQAGGTLSLGWDKAAASVDFKVAK
jgi:hypothetical protein